MLQSKKVARNSLFFIFALSGFAGLIYELIWTNYLKLFLGHAAEQFALSLKVLAAMAMSHDRMAPTS